jgi:hypothetical protein
MPSQTARLHQITVETKNVPLPPYILLHSLGQVPLKQLLVNYCSIRMLFFRFKLLFIFGKIHLSVNTLSVSP